MKINKTYRSNHTPEALFQAWVSPEMTIYPVVRIAVDPRKGGHFILHTKTPDFESTMNGVFLEYEPSSYLKYTWIWSGSEELTTIEVHFLPTPEGSEIKIEHGDFLTEESRSMHDSGWDHYVNELQRKIEDSGQIT